MKNTTHVGLEKMLNQWRRNTDPNYRIFPHETAEIAVNAGAKIEPSFLFTTFSSSDYGSGAKITRIRVL